MNLLFVILRAKSYSSRNKKKKKLSISYSSIQPKTPKINQLDDETRGEKENETEISSKERRLLNHMEKFCSKEDDKRLGGNSHKKFRKIGRIKMNILSTIYLALTWQKNQEKLVDHISDMHKQSAAQ